jgi:hypothetical protein
MDAPLTAIFYRVEYVYLRATAVLPRMSSSNADCRPSFQQARLLQACQLPTSVNLGNLSRRDGSVKTVPMISMQVSRSRMEHVLAWGGGMSLLCTRGMMKY